MTHEVAGRRLPCAACGWKQQVAARRSPMTQKVAGAPEWLDQDLGGYSPRIDKRASRMFSQPDYIKRCTSARALFKRDYTTQNPKDIRLKNLINASE